MATQIKLLTHNIHKGYSFGNKYTLSTLKTTIQSLGADLVLLQEVHGLHRDESQIEFLADQIWPHFAYGKNAVYPKGHHGNAILSKLPIGSWENIDVSWIDRSSRSLLHALIPIEGASAPLHVICVHLGFFGLERSQQVKKLCQRIESSVPANEPLIVAGDFNDWLSKCEPMLETRLQLQEAFKNKDGKHARTFPSFFPLLPVDRIYFRGLELRFCENLNQPPWDQLSDHTALYAELEINA